MARRKSHTPKYGEKVLRQVHSDLATVLKDADSLLKHLDHPQVHNAMVKELQQIVKAIDRIEFMAKKAYPGADKFDPFAEEEGAEQQQEQMDENGLPMDQDPNSENELEEEELHPELTSPEGNVQIGQPIATYSPLQTAEAAAIQGDAHLMGDRGSIAVASEDRTGKQPSPIEAIRGMELGMGPNGISNKLPGEKGFSNVYVKATPENERTAQRLLDRHQELGGGEPIETGYGDYHRHDFSVDPSEEGGRPHHYSFVAAQMPGGSWDVSFHRRNPNSSSSPRRYDLIGDSSPRHARDVMAHVAGAMHNFIQEKKPHSLEFSAMMHEGERGEQGKISGRARLYDHLANVFGDIHDYDVHTVDDPEGQAFRKRYYRLTKKPQSEQKSLRVFSSKDVISLFCKTFNLNQLSPQNAQDMLDYLDGGYGSADLLDGPGRRSVLPVEKRDGDIPTKEKAIVRMVQVKEHMRKMPNRKKLKSMTCPGCGGQGETCSCDQQPELQQEQQIQEGIDRNNIPDFPPAVQEAMEWLGHMQGRDFNLNEEEQQKAYHYYKTLEDFSRRFGKSHAFHKEVDDGHPSAQRGHGDYIKRVYQELEARAPQKRMPSDDISPEKARQILHDGKVRGHPLTPAQSRMFGAAAGKDQKQMGSMGTDGTDTMAGPASGDMSGTEMGSTGAMSLEDMTKYLLKMVG